MVWGCEGVFVDSARAPVAVRGEVAVVADDCAKAEVEEGFEAAPAPFWRAD